MADDEDVYHAMQRETPNNQFVNNPQAIQIPHLEHQMGEH